MPYIFSDMQLCTLHLLLWPFYLHHITKTSLQSAETAIMIHVLSPSACLNEPPTGPASLSPWQYDNKCYNTKHSLVSDVGHTVEVNPNSHMWVHLRGSLLGMISAGWQSWLVFQQFAVERFSPTFLGHNISINNGAPELPQHGRHCAFPWGNTSRQPHQIHLKEKDAKIQEMSGK